MYLLLNVSKFMNDRSQYTVCYGLPGGKVEWAFVEVVLEINHSSKLDQVLETLDVSLSAGVVEGGAARPILFVQQLI